MKRTHIRMSRIFAALASVVIVIFITDGVARSLLIKDTEACIENIGRFPEKKIEGGTVTVSNDAATEPSTVAMKVADEGYSITQISAEEISQGYLAPATDSNPIQPKNDIVYVNLSDYGNEYYGVRDGSLVLNEKAAEALNLMMADYSEVTYLSDFIVYGTTDTYSGEDSSCPRKYAECVSGNTIDLALMAYGSIISYDGYDAEGWVIQNCANYGYIVRYPNGKSDKTGENYCPWHLRYVGQPHALFMTANNMCLEEYIEYVKQYSYETPLEINVGNDVYNVFYVLSEGELTSIPTPITGGFDVSGDNSAGFIVTIKK